jgi:hypothetical protein
MTSSSTRLSEALARYEEEHAFARQVLMPEEDRAKYGLDKWQGGYRWFRSRNVVCLEKYSRLRPDGAGEEERRSD